MRLVGINKWIQLKNVKPHTKVWGIFLKHLFPILSAKGGSASGMTVWGIME
jgi:hypothetical protein